MLTGCIRTNLTTKPTDGRHTSTVYILSKGHKPGNPGRPIVSLTGHSNKHTSYFADCHIHTLVHELTSFVQEPNDFLEKLLTIDYLLLVSYI